MNKRFTIFLVICLALTIGLSAQTVSDRFTTIRPWRVGYGNWAVDNGRLVQSDVNTGLARIDREIPRHDGIITVSFNVLYEDGGFGSEKDLFAGHYHGGFGIHVGVKNAALGKRAWGNGQSFLLWLNLDTRPATMRNAPEHYGFRAQVYESKSNSSMSLVKDPAIVPYIGTDVMSIDIINALRAEGLMYTLDDFEEALDYIVPVTIEINTGTGDIWVQDPIDENLWYWLYLDPAKLKGNYVSLRTNSLAMSFGNFRVTMQ